MVPFALLCQGDPGINRANDVPAFINNWPDAGARFIPVDIADSSVAALKDQFHGFDTIINCMGFVAGAGTQIKITRAVLEAGVKRYFPWQFGVNYDVVGKGSGQPVWTNSMTSGRFCASKTSQSG
ncbi:oxidoreductase [Salmonella enterica subsp. enterica]|uniref:Oxidoreductase n=1 Tax=Salmonella enterica I TaxID=59201 RepID=A0A379WTU7_SALET|nr:oxidoreductase [Salmonella enterica subsp. enterica]